MAVLRSDSGQEFRVADRSMSLGRDLTCDLALVNDSKISRSHAEIRMVDQQWILSDLGSRNGTMVNHRRIRQHPLRGGDEIQLGDTTLVFVAEHDPNATQVETNVQINTSLSHRELQVLALIAQGRTDREIGERLFISPSTVRSHLDRVREKTGLRRRAELTRLALDLGAEV
jgi:pSer/pThr/pTyr-binding forkhead associated (FHA) protein